MFTIEEGYRVRLKLFPLSNEQETDVVAAVVFHHHPSFYPNTNSFMVKANIRIMLRHHGRSGYIFKSTDLVYIDDGRECGNLRCMCPNRVAYFYDFLNIPLIMDGRWQLMPDDALELGIELSLGKDTIATYVPH